MFALTYFLEALASILDMALNIYTWVIIARALLSWVNPDPYNPAPGARRGSRGAAS